MLLVAVVAIATLVFASSGRLIYFVNPAYVVFTVVMAAIALAFCVAWIAFRIRGRGTPAHDDHDHEDDADELPRTTPRRIGLVVGAAVAVAIGAGLLVLPPAVLSSATAVQRDVASTTALAPAPAASAATSTATAHFTVLDWSSLLRQTTDPGFYTGKPVDVTGFVTPDPKGSDDVYYLTRFVITCCAVDAQPAAVPVYQPGWRDTVKADQWLTVRGAFQASRSTRNDAPIALVPAQTRKVDAPSDPYLY
jgi:putative membrane protein